MKDNLFEMLLSLFEKTLAQLKEMQQSLEAEQSEAKPAEPEPEQTPNENEVRVEVFRAPRHTSMRVFTEAERLKLTKASYQFLQRITTWQVITPQVLELIIHRIMLSESRVVNLEETKWAIRTFLEDSIEPEQLAFLDLVLFKKSDKVAVH